MPNKVFPSFSNEQYEQIEKLYSGFTQEQLVWMSGYSAGLSSYARLFNGATASQVTNNESPAASSAAPEKRKLTILYGSHSGNSKSLAAEALKVAQNLNIDASVADMAQYKTKNIKNEQDILVIVSTHGQGVPPMSAEELYAYLHGKKAPSLEGVRFAVIALGDSSYKLFCKTGYDFDAQLKALGAQSVSHIAALDVDYKDAIDSVLSDIVGKFNTETASQTTTSGPKTEKSSSSNDIFEADLITKQILNGRGSSKETYHFEINLEGSNFSFLPGDALEVYATNNPELVNKIIDHLKLDPDHSVLVGNKATSIKDALLHHYEITVINPQVIKKISEASGSDNLKGLLADEEKLDKYLYGSDLLDILTEYSIDLTAKQLTDVLRKLPPRLYSISSSLDANPDEVHITVGAVRFEKNSREREGVASTFLADRVPEDGKIAVRIKQNEGFRLPQDGSAPAIMVGPGTGIAPFRAFLQQRENDGTDGKNWLFFGDQHFTTDFLYQTEILKWKNDGVLTNLDVAFSRDQEEKIYVQHRLKQKSKEVFEWLQNGSYFYVCGDMKKMAKDVKETLLQIIETEGKLSKEAAAEYFNNLKKSHRYQEDVY